MCVFSDEPLRLECDLLGLGTIFDELFRGRSDVPYHMLRLVKSCSSASHDARPALEYVK